MRSPSHVNASCRSIGFAPLPSSTGAIAATIAGRPTCASIAVSADAADARSGALLSANTCVMGGTSVRTYGSSCACRPLASWAAMSSASVRTMMLLSAYRALSAAHSSPAAPLSRGCGASAACTPSSASLRTFQLASPSDASDADGTSVSMSTRGTRRSSSSSSIASASRGGATAAGAGASAAGAPPASASPRVRTNRVGAGASPACAAISASRLARSCAFRSSPSIACSGVPTNRASVPIALVAFARTAAFADLSAVSRYATKSAIGTPRVPNASRSCSSHCTASACALGALSAASAGSARATTNPGETASAYT